MMVDVDPKERVIQLGNELLNVIYDLALLAPQVNEYGEKMQPPAVFYLPPAEVATALNLMAQAATLTSKQLMLMTEYVELRKSLFW